MPYTALDAAAARRAIYHGDDATLERYLRESGGQPYLSVTAATGALAPGYTVINRAAGFTGTLPPARGSLDRYTIVVQTTLTGSGIIKVANSLDSMVGFASYGTVSAAAGSTQGAPAGTDTITMNGGTSGGLAGSNIYLVDIAANLWFIEANLIGAGAVSTPFSNTV